MTRAVVTALAIVLASIPGAAIGPPDADVDSPPRTSSASVDLPVPGRSVADRFAEIRDRVQRVVVYPPIARKREVEGESIVEFAIDAKGRAVDIKTLLSAGNRLLDEAAITAVERAAPLPWVYGRIIVPVRFALNDPT